MIFGCNTNQESKVANDYPAIIYKVENIDNNNYIYVFGTVHVGNDDLYPFRDEIENAFNESDYLAVEADIINVDTQSITNNSPSANPIADLISEQTRNNFIEVLKTYPTSYQNIKLDYDNLKNFNLKTVNDILILSALEQTKYSINRGMDRYFLMKAITNN